MRRFGIVVNSIAKVSDSIAIIAVVAMMIIVVANVLGRLFKVPITGSMDLISMLGGILVSLSIAYCEVQKGHLAVTIVIDYLPKRARKITEAATLLISVGLFAVIAWACGVWGTRLLHTHRLLEVLRIPIFPFVYVLGFGALTLALVLLVNLFELLSKRGSE